MDVSVEEPPKNFASIVVAVMVRLLAMVML
jgi:hypothetical protein